LSAERQTFSKDWEQFSIIRTDAHKQITEHAHTNIETEYLLIVTQTCDLVESDLNKEPFFEVIPLNPTNKKTIDSNVGSTKSTRLLQIEITLKQESVIYELNMHQRFWVNHGVLARIVLIDSIPYEDKHETRSLIKQWFINRYTRAAKPDQFDKYFSINTTYKYNMHQYEENKQKVKIPNINAKLSHITKMMKPAKALAYVLDQMTYVNNIYIMIDPYSEIEEGEDYYINLLITSPAREHSEGIIIWKERDKPNLIELFKETKGIILDNTPQYESDSEVTLGDLKKYIRYNYDFLSYKSVDHVNPDK